MAEATTVAVILGLAYLGKDIASDFLKRVFAPAGDAAGKVLSHPIEEWQQRRVERARLLANEAAEMLERAGTQARAVPGRILWPILERGSLEENEGLGSKWATLLANAADSRIRVDVTPAFVRILADLTPAEAVLLDNQWTFITEQLAGRGFAHHVRFRLADDAIGADGDAIAKHLVSLGLLDEVREYRIDVNDVGERLANAIQRKGSFPITRVETHVSCYYMSVLGIRFLTACRPPDPEALPVEPS